jgi:paraquat-inducible protein B
VSETKADDARASRRTAPAQAALHKSWWPGWIWAVPIAAVAIGVWLLVRFLTQGGSDITITFSNAYGIDPSSTDIQYRGMKVGSVTGIDLSKDGSHVDVSANIKDSAAKFLTSDTLFWLRGANPSLSDLSSLGAVLSGPTIVIEPGGGKSATHFNGITHKPAVPLHSGEPVVFGVSFDGPVGALTPGDPVKLRGFTVGEVKTIGFRYDLSSDQIETPVTLTLYPGLFHFEGAPAAKRAAGFKTALASLVRQGLRASLDRDPPLIGGYQVGFEMIPGAPAATLDVAASQPQIPTAPGGGLQSIVTQVNKIPLDQIGQNVLDLTKQIDQLASSPKLKESVAELDASLRDIHDTIKEISPKMNQLVQTLRATAEQLDRASAAADKTLGGTASQTGLQDTMHEVKDAARSIRSLADYLERHPEALISGKHGD